MAIKTIPIIVAQRRLVVYYRTRFHQREEGALEETSSDEKDNVAFCILCSVKMKAVKVSAEAKKLSKHQSASLGKAVPKKKMKSMKATNGGIIRELRRLAAFQAQLYIFTKVEKLKPLLDIR